MMKTKLLKTTAVTMTLILALGLSACTSGNSKDSGKDSSSGKTAQTSFLMGWENVRSLRSRRLWTAGSM